MSKRIHCLGCINFCKKIDNLKIDTVCCQFWDKRWLSMANGTGVLPFSNTNSCTADPVCWVQLPSALVYSTWEMSKGTFLLSSINIISNLDKMKATLRSLGASSVQHCWDSRQRCVWHLIFKRTDAKLWKQLNSFFLLCYKQYDGLFLFDAQRFGTGSNLILLIWHCFVQVQVKRMINF